MHDTHTKIDNIKNKFLMAVMAPSALTALCFSVAVSSEDHSPTMALQEIVVTATKRAQSKQDVPISMSAVGGDDIEASGSDDLMALSNYVPNFVFGQSYNAASSEISIRGAYNAVAVGTIGADQGVGVYIDGVYAGKQFNGNQNFGEVERVEVLRGPQGTLFGKNTISGAINIITKKPGDEANGGITVDIGSRGLLHTKGFVSIPIVEDKLALKVSGGNRDQDGFVDNTTTGQNDYAGGISHQSGRIQARYTPSEKTTVDISADSFDADLLEYQFEIITGTQHNDDLKFTQTSNHPTMTSTSRSAASISIEHMLDNNFTVTSISGWRDDELAWEGDTDGAVLDFAFSGGDLSQSQFTQEVRLASPANDSYDFVAGIYYLRQDAANRQKVTFGAMRGPVAGNILSGSDVNTDSMAAFVNANFHMNHDLTLHAGLRYTDETKEGIAIPTACPMNPVTCAATRQPTLTQATSAPDLHTKEPSWTFGISQSFSDDAMIYGSVSRGIKSAAYADLKDPVAQATTGDLTADAEFVTNYEIGAKTNWLDRRIELNIAAFSMNYEDMQVRTTDLTTAVPTMRLSNAAEASTKGLEVEFKARVSESLLISGGVGYTDAQFDDYQGHRDSRTRAFVDVSGMDIPLAPNLTVNMIASHTIQIAGGTLITRLDYSFTDSRYSNSGVNNTDDYLLPTRDLVNARMSYSPSGSDWNAALWIRNATDYDGKTFSSFRPVPPPSGVVVAKYQEPRSYGVSLKYPF